MRKTAVGANRSAPGATTQRMSEIELMFIGLLGNFESLRDQHSEVCRRLAALELDHAAEAVTR